MSEISFKSTFRIPVTQAGVNNSKKLKLKSLLGSYPNSLVGTGKTGYARISMPNSKDENFIRKLKGIGYKVFQIFEAENLKKTEIDPYIQQALTTGEYAQKGKQKAAAKQRPLSRGAKAIKEKIEQAFVENTSESTRKFDTNVNYKKPLQSESLKPEVNRHQNLVSNEERNRIRETEDYKRIAKKYGDEFADAAFFFTRKK